MATVQVACANKATYITESFLGVFMSYLGIHQGFSLRGCWGPRPIAKIEPQALHGLLHELILLQLESDVVLLAGIKELPQKDEVVLLGICSQAHIIDVCFDLGTMDLRRRLDKILFINSEKRFGTLAGQRV